jgi:hypothetical protein
LYRSPSSENKPFSGDSAGFFTQLGDVPREWLLDRQTAIGQRATIVCATRWTRFGPLLATIGIDYFGA